MVAVAAGNSHSLALCPDGTVAAWGNNDYGQLGNSSYSSSRVPVAVTSSGILSGKTVVAIAAGQYHSLALCSDGTVAAWGSNGYGQLGNNSYSSSSIPVAVTTTGILTGKTVTNIAAGYYHSLALCSDGTVAAWGSNDYGQLGNNSTSSSSIPVAVSASSLAAGERFVAAASGQSSQHSLALVAAPPWPVVATGAATSITSADATLNASVNANSNSTAVSFEYGLTTAYGSTIAATPSSLTGEASTAVSASLSGLIPGTTYHYRVNATNAAGSTTGGDMTFATPSTNANLSDLALGIGTLAPAFSSTTSAYTVSVSTYSITIKPTVADVTASVRVNGSVVASGTFSSEIPLVVGPNVISTVVTAQDGITTKTYNITVTRRNADLASLATSAGTLAPAFSSAMIAYTVLVTNTTASITLAPVVADAAATVRVNGSIVNSGGNSDAIHLAFGPNPIGIVVSAGDGITTKTYNLMVIRPSADLASLTISAGALTPVFDSATTAYTMSVPFDVTGLRLTPTLADSTATLTVNGTIVSSGTPSGIISLTAGANTISIVVTALDASTRTYTLVVSRTQNLVYSYNSAGGVASTLGSLTATGSAAILTLNFAPVAGTNLTVVNNTGPAPISGRFSNLAQGQPVLLTFGGINYPFVVNYYGGNGNDLVLQWANTRALAWGYNYYGQLGNNSSTNSSVPVAATSSGILSGKTVTNIAAGDSHSLALCSDGTVAAWGYNGYGQLGNNSTTNSSVPVAVTSSGILADKTVVAIAAGGYHSLALCSDGTVAAWGYNGNGQLGDNGYTYSSSVPVAVTSSGILTGKTVVAIAAGYYHSLALCSDGTVAAWGNNDYGQLGAGNTSTAVTATGILTGKTVVAIAAGNSHSLALCSDGTLAAWGHNGYGQLGNGSATDSSVPVAVTSSGILSGKTVANIAAGYSHSLAVCSDGTVAAWGYNGYGQLGTGNTSTSSVPVAATASGILSSKTVTNIAAGYYHSLAPCSDGTVAAWGRNNYGQLGNNSTSTSSVPVAVSASSLVAGERFGAAASGQSSQHSLALVATPPWPVLATAAATSITSAGATLNGFVNANSNSTAVSFEYGLTTAYGSTIAATPAPVTGEASTAVSASLGGLTSATTYHYRVSATNAAGTSPGTDMTFGTLSSSNAFLADLSLGSGTLSPAFSSSTSAYTAVVATAVIIVKPTTAHPGATVKVNGVTVTSGSFSSAIPLSLGSNVLSTVVTAQDGITTDTYTVTVTRLNGDLASLTTSAGTLSPSFSSAAAGYTVSVSYATTSVTIKPTVDDTQATVKVNGILVNSGSDSEAIPLAVGLNVISVVVTAQDGFTTNTYTVTVIRISTNANLAALWPSSGKLIPAFDSATTGYTMTVPFAVNHLRLAPILADHTATVRVSGIHVDAGCFGVANQLAVGSNNISIVVTAQDTSFTKSYNVTVTRLGASALNPNSVVAWGAGRTNTHLDPEYGQAVIPAGLSGMTTALAAGLYHTVALKNDGTVVAWGENTYGQVTGTATANLSAIANPVTLGGVALSGVTSIAAGALHTLALRNDGTVVAWGAGKTTVAGTANLGQAVIPAGLTTLSGVAATIPANTTGLINTITLGSANSGIVPGMFVTGPGFTVGLGAKVSGVSGTTVTLSVPNTNTALTPAALTFSTGVVAIAAGYYHSVALKADGSVVAWGDNASGQTTVPGGLAAVAVLASVNASPATTVTATATAAIVPGMSVTGPGIGVGAMVVGITGSPVATLTLSVPNTNVATLSGQYLTFTPGAIPIAIAAGNEHTVALKNDGTVVAWGRNVEGQTTLPGGLSGVTAIVAGGDTSYALKSDGTVVAWGDNLHGQRDVPAGLSGVTAIAAGGHHAMALKNDGTVVAWGRIWNGSGLVSETVPLGLRGVSALAAGAFHSVALAVTQPPIITTQPASVTVNQGGTATLSVVAAGTAPLTYQWRKNGADLTNTGNISGTNTATLILTNVQLTDASSYSAVVTDANGSVTSVGADLTVIASSPDAVVAWGAGKTNTGVDPEFGQSVVPAGLAGVTKSVAAGAYHSVALKTDGTVAAWGNNSYGQTNLPSGLSGVTAIAAGGLHTLALKSNGSVVAWGAGKTNTSTVAVPTVERGQSMIPAGLTTLSGVAATIPRNDTGLVSTITLGASNSGIVPGMSVSGPGFTVGAGAKVLSVASTAVTLSVPNVNGVLTPTTLTFSAGVVAIAAGYYHSVALKSDGSVVAWGDNTESQTTVPAGLQTLSATAALPPNPDGSLNTINLASDNANILPGMLVTGPYGSVGVGANITSKAGAAPFVLTMSVPDAANTNSVAANIPFLFSPGVRVVGIAAGYEHTVALKSDGTVVAWGRNVEGQTNTGGLSGVSAVAAGGDFTVALKNDGTVVALGDNYNGQTNVPAGLGGVTAIAAGGDHAVALKSDGTVVTWGKIWNGSAYVQETIPAGLGGVTAIAAGLLHTVAIIGGPTIIIGVQPVSRTNVIGTTATFSVTATGTAPLSYQWQKNGVNLTNSGSVSGATTTTLTLAHVQATDAANYSVVVTDAYGSMTSMAATLTVIPNLLPDAVDCPDLVWTTGGDAPWLAQTATTHDGIDAARSGAITDSQESWLQTTVAGPGILGFWWQVSSEDAWDCLEFYLDGVLQSGRISGESGWQQRTVTIPSGAHTARWRYMKDEWDSSGQDAGWLDSVSYVSANTAPQIATQPESRINVAGTTATFTVTATGSSPLTYQWRNNELNLADGGNVFGTTTATLTLTSVQLADVGSYTVVVTNAYGSVTSTAATLALAPPLVATGTASGITTTTATLNGTVNPNGLTTTARVEYGLTTAYGSKVRVTLSPDDGFLAQNVSATLGGLLPGRTYHYRFTATSGGGTSQGDDMTFAIPAVPITPAELVAPQVAITGNHVNLTIERTVPGRGYQLQCSDTMVPGTWRDVGAVRVGDGNPLVITTPRESTAPQRFYRIALQN
ncbi:MAG: cadherin-like beta sandwich domain-containing protein [Verrucomicrobia bacterium]|nr:cadherin-like beta sandwich domain-containing protein [Verrucomicrobiota bacterium]